MAVVVFAEIDNQQYKKASLEAIGYGKKVAAQLGTECIALTLQTLSNSGDLGTYGADKVVSLNLTDAFVADSCSSAVSQACQQLNAQVVVISNSYVGKSLAPRVAVSLGASLATNVISLPETANGFQVKRGVFSGKAFAYTELKNNTKVLALTPNSFDLTTDGSACAVDSLSINASMSPVKITASDKVTGKIPLTEAEIVVSAGRGMKGPEHWNMVEELADLMGAATACSKPVSDMGWRPHSEHVGQTGITIKPNLYVAIGISGAIQHLAGVSSSKTIVAINKDPEAPFFKAADYGIVGDAFEVLPQLISALKN
jgi:electron transfer flavoprotein alpha subunit